MAVNLKYIFIMRIIAFILILWGSTQMGYSSTTDSTRTVMVGDSVYINQCKNNTYKYIQYYRKTRIVDLKASYNKETGDDFFEYFFTDGDFDVKTLPCEFGLKKYKILSIKTLVDKETGLDRPVMFLELGLHTVAWIELNGAVNEMEIYLQ